MHRCYLIQLEKQISQITFSIYRKSVGFNAFFNLTSVHLWEQKEK